MFNGAKGRGRRAPSVYVTAVENHWTMGRRNCTCCTRCKSVRIISFAYCDDDSSTTVLATMIAYSSDAPCVQAAQPAPAPYCTRVSSCQYTKHRLWKCFLSHLVGDHDVVLRRHVVGDVVVDDQPKQTVQHRQIHLKGTPPHTQQARQARDKTTASTG